MSTTTKTNKATAVDVDTMVIAGIAKYFANVPKLTFLGTDYSATTLTSAIQAEVDALKALDNGHAQLKQQVADTKGVRVKTRALRAAIRKHILSFYGSNAVQVLEDFGFQAPIAPGPKTAMARAQAAAKAAATRKARREAAAKAVAAPPAAAAAASVSTTPAK